MGFFDKVRGVLKDVVQIHKISDVGLVGSVFRHPKAAAAIVGAGAVTAISPSAAIGIARQVIPKTAKGKILAVGLGIPAIQLLKASPKAREATVGSAAQFGSAFVKGEIPKGIASVIEGEKSIKEFVKEHPIFTGGAALAGAAAVSSVVPAGLAFVAGSALRRDSRREGRVVEKVPPSAPSVTTPLASPSAKVTTPPVSSPVAIPKSVPARRTTTRRKRRTGCPHSHVKGNLNLRWS